MSDRLLEIRNLTMQFGGVTALSKLIYMLLKEK